MVNGQKEEELKISLLANIGSTFSVSDSSGMFNFPSR